MVDALRRAHRIVHAGGFVVDLHPSATSAVVGIGPVRTGLIDAFDAALRHAGAGVALASVVDDGLYAIERTSIFTYTIYSDTIEELRDYVATHWRDGRIDAATVERTRGEAPRHPGSRPYVAERIHATKLRPLTR